MCQPLVSMHLVSRDCFFPQHVYVIVCVCVSAPVVFNNKSHE